MGNNLNLKKTPKTRLKMRQFKNQAEDTTIQKKLKLTFKAKYYRSNGTTLIKVIKLMG